MPYRENFSARFGLDPVPDVTPEPVPLLADLLRLFPVPPNTPTETDTEDINDESGTPEVTEPVTDPATIPADANTGGSNAGA